MAAVAPSRLDSSTMNCSFSFQPELLTSRQQTDGFAKAFFLRFLSFGRMNPTYKVTAVGWRQTLEETPCLRILLQRFGHVGRQVRDCRARGVCVVGRRRRQPGSREQAGRFEFQPALAIDLGPLAGGLSRRE